MIALGATLAGSAACQLVALCTDPGLRAGVPYTVMLRLRHIVRSTAAPTALRGALYAFFALDQDPVWVSSCCTVCTAVYRT